MATIKDIEGADSLGIYLLQERIKNQFGSLCGLDFRLEKTVKSDLAVLSKNGISIDQVSDRLDSIIGQAETLWSLEARKHPTITLDLGRCPHPTQKNGVIVEDKYSVKISNARTSHCPFFVVNDGTLEDCPRGKSITYSIKNMENGKNISISNLLLHIIKQHHYFGWKHTSRLDPQSAIDCLELIPGVDYKPGMSTEYVWIGRGGSTDTQSDFLGAQVVIENSDLIQQITPQSRLYVRENKAAIVSDTYNQIHEPVYIRGEQIIIGHGDLYKGVNVYERQEVQES